MPKKTSKMGRDAGKNFEINDRVKRAHNTGPFINKKLSDKQFESLGDQARGVSKKLGSKEMFGPIKADEKVGQGMRDKRAISDMKDFKFLKHKTKGK